MNLVKNLPKIYGFNRSSDGGPDPFGVSIFLSRCNMKCSYCMNWRLVIEKGLEEIDFEEIKKFILERNIKWVSISGGEPTVSENLPELIDELKLIGVNINLCTNGINTKILMDIIDKLAYVTLDIKTDDPNLYRDWSFEGAFERVLTTKSLLKKNKLAREDFNYEVRTTIVPKFINNETIMNLSSIIDSDEKWVLQKFRITKDVSSHSGDEDCIDEKIVEMEKIAKDNGNLVEIRYI